MNSSFKALAAVVCVFATSAVWAADVDAGAAEALMKKSGCNKCHSVDKKKEGPPYQETAGKYKGKADGEDKLYKHLTTNPKIKVEGKEEEHTSLKTKKDDEVRNVVRWVLSR
jgi:cytochrome c